MGPIGALCAEDPDDQALLWIDHRDEDDGIIEPLSRSLGDGDEIAVDWRDDDLWATYRGTARRIPLTFTPHDRYVAIGSVAALVKNRYGLYGSKSSLRSDTHGVVVLSHAEVASASDAARRALQEPFTRIEPGTDSFGGPALPCVGHEDHNPEFAAQAAAFDQGQRETMQAVRSELQGDLQALRRRRRWRIVPCSCCGSRWCCTSRAESGTPSSRRPERAGFRAAADTPAGPAASSCPRSAAG